MNNDTDAILDDLLSRWHEWAKGFKLTERGASPVGRRALRAKGEQTLAAIAEDTWQTTTMEGINLAVAGDKQGLGGMDEPYRTAIYINARNCYTGRSVWLSPRLPSDREAREAILKEARSILLYRLTRAGIV